MSFIFSPFSNKEMTIANYNIASSNSEELLVVVIDSEVTFAKHVENLCQKLHALVRVANFMTLVMKTFVFSQFGYCPLVWMCHSRKWNNKLNRLQERTLCIVYNDKSSIFYQLLEKDNQWKFILGIFNTLQQKFLRLKLVYQLLSEAAIQRCS